MLQSAQDLEPPVKPERFSIGPAKAEAIVAYREANGPFSSVEDLVLVKGIGGATLEKNRGKLTAVKP